MQLSSAVNNFFMIFGQAIHCIMTPKSCDTKHESINPCPSSLGVNAVVPSELSSESRITKFNAARWCDDCDGASRPIDETRGLGSWCSNQNTTNSFLSHHAIQMELLGHEIIAKLIMKGGIFNDFTRANQVIL